MRPKLNPIIVAAKNTVNPTTFLSKVAKEPFFFFCFHCNLLKVTVVFFFVVAMKISFVVFIFLFVILVTKHEQLRFILQTFFFPFLST